MKSWGEFCLEDSELADLGKAMLFRAREDLGLAFLATIRKDGGPRLHPVSLVFFHDHLYVFIPPTSPKCADLKRDGRYALQAFPPTNNEIGKEFYITGRAGHIQDQAIYQLIIIQSGVHVEEREDLFELFLEKAMYTELMDCGTPDELPLHRVWKA